MLSRIWQNWVASALTNHLTHCLLSNDVVTIQNATVDLLFLFVVIFLVDVDIDVVITVRLGKVSSCQRKLRAESH